ncbi:MAG: trypsin-like peptidase domain-containing protein [Caulobacteraceae bacterium]
MFKFSVAALSAALLVCAGSRAEAQIAGPNADGEVRAVSLAKIVTKISREARWAEVQSGPSCRPTGQETWSVSADQLQTSDLERVFRAEMQSAGFRVEGDPDNLFEQPASFGEFAVGAVIRGAAGQFCSASEGGSMFKLGRGKESLKGGAALDVEWQIYSRVQRQVIAKIQTHGGDETPRPVARRVEPVLEAFADNVRGLIKTAAFRSAFVGGAEKTQATLISTGRPSIQLAGAGAPRRTTIADAVGSVVLVFAGAGHGSGFLVSSDGYIMTDQHVIGAAKRVRVRWADGVEGVGEVIRSDATRDVALIKTDPRGREPLALRRESMQPGDTVFAIGAPLESRFQNTVTRGVVSAYRTIDGLRYLQSDVTINPGNSGGPLLDENGRVVGMTKSIYRMADGTKGINFFVPTRDALDFLGADPG